MKEETCPNCGSETTGIPEVGWQNCFECGFKWGKPLRPVADEQITNLETQLSLIRARLSDIERNLENMDIILKKMGGT